MTTSRSTDYLIGLVRELCKLPRETEWFELKENSAEPRRIGEYLSALANAAALEGKAFGYLLWGVRDSDHAIVGTRFDPHTTKVGNEEREHASADEVTSLLDYPSYFELIGRPLPDHRAGILAALEEDGVLRQSGAGSWDITNLGAVLFAKRLTDFGPLGRKAVRVIVYESQGRLTTLKEQTGSKGYAAGFTGLLAYINGLVPSNEVIGQALRRSVPMYPELAVRELVANALIHQDFFVTGAGPMIEIFDGRIELTNPGEPLVATDRFVDAPPRSRNEALASLMRRMGICEERGSGVDKVVSQTELYQLPAPLFEVPDGSTRAVLFAHRPLSRMDAEERARACYLHACLRYVNREYLTNASVRERFGLDDKNAASASRLIKETVTAGLIAPVDENAAKKLMKVHSLVGDGRGCRAEHREEAVSPGFLAARCLSRSLLGQNPPRKQDPSEFARYLLGDLGERPATKDAVVFTRGCAFAGGLAGGLMLTSLEIENFKGIAARQRIDFAPLTLLFGANSAGKSSIVQALVYLHELVERSSADVDRTELGGHVLELGGFARLVHQHDTARGVVLRAEFARRERRLRASRVARGRHDDARRGAAPRACEPRPPAPRQPWRRGSGSTSSCKASAPPRRGPRRGGATLSCR